MSSGTGASGPKSTLGRHSRRGGAPIIPDIRCRSEVQGIVDDRNADFVAIEINNNRLVCDVDQSWRSVPKAEV